MVELNGVTNAYGLGGGIEQCVSAVVVEGLANAESVPCAELPCLAWSGFVVDGDFASDWAEQCSIVVNRTVVIFPH